MSVGAAVEPVNPGRGQSLELGRGAPEPAKEREAAGAPGKSQGRKGGGQRKQDLAEAPTSPIRKQPLSQPLTPRENLWQAREGEGIPDSGMAPAKARGRGGSEVMALRIWGVLCQVLIPQWGGLVGA